MKYDLVPQSPREARALEEAPHARALLDPFLPMVVSRALVAAVRLDLPRSLAGDARTPADLAAEHDMDPDGLGHLLAVLAAAGWVEASGPDGFRLSPLGRLALLPGSPARLDAWVAHNRIHERALAHLEESLLAVGDRDLHHHLESPEDWATYQRAMLQTARPAAAALASTMPEPPTRTLLIDLGGSHGLYGAAVCRRFPPMVSRVLEIPPAIETARAAAESEGIGDVVEHVEADVLEADLGSEVASVVFMGNLVHHVEDRPLADLLARARRALVPGGVLAIWDMAPAPEPDLVGAGFSLLFWLTSACGCRVPGDLVRALEAAGLRDSRIHPPLSPTHVLVTARR